MSQRNTRFVIGESLPNYRLAREHGLVHNHIHKRNGKSLLLDNGLEAIDFINCSYLGIDCHPKVVEAYNSVHKSLGVNFCCARTRLTDFSLKGLEDRLNDMFKGRVVTFPSVTAAHMSVMPLIASGVLINPSTPPKVHMVFDRFAHASMRFLMPILEKECRVSTVGHNNLDELLQIVKDSRRINEEVVYVADGIYSMGGVCPISELLAMAQSEQFYLYIDDAHGTSIIGEMGEGPVLSKISTYIPRNVFVTFSMTKGFGVAGGGIVISEKIQEELIRTYGMVYAFSAPLDFSATRAAHAALDLHFDGTVAQLQEKLKQKVNLFDSQFGIKKSFSPIRMIKIGDEKSAVKIGAELLESGFMTVVAFFPVVARGQAQLRFCISTEHSDSEILRLCSAINVLMTKYKCGKVGSEEYAI